MADLLTLENLGNLIMLCFLQAVLGFDNLLYISIESQRAPVAQQAAVRKWGILLAVALRVVLLFVMIQAIDAMAEPFFVMNWEGVITGGVNFATLVFIIGGIFIMYTAVKEITHMLSVHDLGTDVEGKTGKSAAKVVGLIVLMNLYILVRFCALRAGHHRCLPHPRLRDHPVRRGHAGTGGACDAIP
jgi:predicted tellurium resistance membrane protein TerC